MKILVLISVLVQVSCFCFTGPFQHVVSLCRRFSSLESCGEIDLEHGKDKMTRFRTTPVQLFRLVTTNTVKLREYKSQVAKGSHSYDFFLGEDGLIHPAASEFFEAPNGMSLRPHGIQMWDILASYRGNPKVLILPQGTAIPDDLALFHERSDHYSLQTAIPRTMNALNTTLTKFLSPYEVITKEEYFLRFPLHAKK